jgi:hypothetical protein
MQKIILELTDATYAMLASRCPTGIDGLPDMLLAIISNGEQDFIEDTFKYAYKLGISINATIPTEQEFNRVFPMVKKAQDEEKAKQLALIQAQNEVKNDN